MIELRKINVFFHKNTKLENHVLKNLNLEVLDGQFLTIIGGNGAGKSTLMNILSGDIKPSSGRILIDNKDITKLSTAQRSTLVARVFQDPMLGTFTDLTVEENLSIAAKRGQYRGIGLSLSSSNRERFKEALAELGMKLENRLHDKVLSLSGGQRQALSLIMATLCGSKILLLDEHTAALDPKTGKLIMSLTDKIVKKYRLTALMITHSMTQALDYGNRTVIMSQGRIIEDISSKQRANMLPDDLTKYFDVYLNVPESATSKS